MIGWILWGMRSRKGFCEDMIKLAIVGCTGKLGSAIMKNTLSNKTVEVAYAIARNGNQYVGKNISELIGGKSDVIITDDIEDASNSCSILKSLLYFATLSPLDGAPVFI